MLNYDNAKVTNWPIEYYEFYSRNKTGSRSPNFSKVYLSEHLNPSSFLQVSRPKTF